MVKNSRSRLTMRDINAFDVQIPNQIQTGSDALNRVGQWAYKPNTSERDWQEAAYAFARDIPEIGQAIEHTANTVKSCKLVILEETDDGPTPVEFGDPADVTLRALLSESSDTYDDIMYSMARALQIAGECFFVGEAVDGDEANGLIWEVYSVREMFSKGKGWDILESDGSRTLDDEAVVDRLHRSDAEYRWKASSPMRRVLALCGQLMLLEQNIKAVAESRLSAQVWYMPEDITLHTVDESQASATGPGSQVNPVVRKFLEHASAPINNPDSAARLVPLVMTGPVDGKDRMGIIDVSRAPDAVQSALREEVIIRIARGLDIPIEVIFGIGETNHWTSFGISAQFLGDHIEPLGNRIAAFLTRKYLRPMLQAGYDMTVEEVLRFRFEFDTSPVTSRVDDGPATRAAFDRGEASAARYRASIGLTEADAPDVNELARRDVRRLMQSASVTYGPEVLKYLYPDDSAVQALADLMIESAAARSGMEEDKPETGNETDNGKDDEAEKGDGPEDSQDEPEKTERQEAAIELLVRIQASADRDVRRAIERATAKTVTKARAPRFSDVLGRLNLTSNKLHQVANLSDSDMKQLGLVKANLLVDEFSSLTNDVYEWVVEYLFEFDTDGLVNEGKAQRCSTLFSSAVEALAISALSAPIVKTGKGFLVPDELLDVVRAEL